MHIGAGLEGSIHPGDERDFILHFFQRLQRGRQLERMHTNGNAYTIVERLAVRSKLRNGAVFFAWKKPAPNHADGHIKKCRALGWGLIGRRKAHALEPRQAQCGPAESP